MSWPKRTIKLYLLFATSLVLLCSCGDEVEPTPLPAQATAWALSTQVMVNATTPIENTDFTAQIQEAKSIWAAQQIDNYTLEIWYSQPNWNTQIINITVVDGLVTDSSHTCYPERSCILRDVDPAQLTIDKLLEVAESVNNLGLPAADVSITFNQEYGYPTSIVTPDLFFNPGSFQPTNKP